MNTSSVKPEFSSVLTSASSGQEFESTSSSSEHRPAKGSFKNAINQSFNAQTSLLEENLGLNDEQLLSCSYENCKKTFPQISALKKHEKTHRGEKPYVCADCGQGFSQISNLKRHERLHTGERPFTCEECKRTFSTLSNLKQHQQVHEETEHREKFSCKYCPRSYFYQSSLTKHLKSHQKEGKLDDIFDGLMHEEYEPVTTKFLHKSDDSPIVNRPRIGSLPLPAKSGGFSETNSSSIPAISVSLSMFMQNLSLKPSRKQDIELEITTPKELSSDLSNPLKTSQSNSTEPSNLLNPISRALQADFTSLQNALITSQAPIKEIQHPAIELQKFLQENVPGFKNFQPKSVVSDARNTFQNNSHQLMKPNHYFSNSFSSRSDLLGMNPALHVRSFHNLGGSAFQKVSEPRQRIASFTHIPSQNMAPAHRRGSMDDYAILSRRNDDLLLLPQLDILPTLSPMNSITFGQPQKNQAESLYNNKQSLDLPDLLKQSSRLSVDIPDFFKQNSRISLDIPDFLRQNSNTETKYNLHLGLTPTNDTTERDATSFSTLSKSHDFGGFNISREDVAPQTFKKPDGRNNAVEAAYHEHFINHEATNNRCLTQTIVNQNDRTFQENKRGTASLLTFE